MQHKDPQLMEKIRLYAMNYYREHNQMPSIRTIADGTGMNRGSVQKYLVEMQEEQGHLQRRDYRFYCLRPPRGCGRVRGGLCSPACQHLWQR